MSGRSGRPSARDSGLMVEVEPVITVEGTVLFRGTWVGGAHEHVKKEEAILT